MPSGREGLTVALCVLVAVLVALGVAWAVARREPGPLLLLVTSAVAALYLVPRLSPYAGGKVLALASPVAVFGAALGLWAVARRSAVAGAVLALVVAGGVLWSDALAYHVVRLAPIDRLEALDDTGERVQDLRGLVLLNEPEEFAKVYDGGANINTATEAITPRQIQLRAPQGFQARYFDLDEHRLDYLQDFDAIIKRRSPDASRPPAEFRRAYANGWYELWLRRDGTRVLEHLPLQGVHRAAVLPSCADVLALAERAGPGETLVAAKPAVTLMLDTARARRSAGWLPHPWQPEMVVTATPGTATASVRAAAPGRYDAWVAGSFGRPIDAEVDGTRVGDAVGVNNLGQWLPAGEVSLIAAATGCACAGPAAASRPATAMGATWARWLSSWRGRARSSAFHRSELGASAAGAGTGSSACGSRRGRREEVAQRRLDLVARALPRALLDERARARAPSRPRPRGRRAAARARRRSRRARASASSTSSPDSPSAEADVVALELDHAAGPRPSSRAPPASGS